jgi:hypothetical protein
MTKGFSNEIEFGEALLARLQGAPPLLAKPGKELARALAELKKTEDAVGSAHDQHRDAVRTTAAIDLALHDALDTLATALVASGLSKRERAFAGFSAVNQTQLLDLPYREQSAAVKKLTGAVLKKKPHEAVKEAAAKCAKLAASLDKTLKSRVAPDAQGAKDTRARNAAYVAFEQAVSKLRKFAKAAYADDPAAEVALFMPADGIVHHKAKPAKPTAPAT